MTRWLMLPIAALCACGNNAELDIPSPPNYQSRSDAFDAPTGTVGSSPTGDLLLGAAGVLVAGSELSELVGSLLDPDARSSEQTLVSREDGRNKISVSGDGYLELIHRCDNEGGRVELIGRFSESGIDPVLWGESDDCLKETDVGTVSFDGPIIVELSAAPAPTASESDEPLEFDVIIPGRGELLGIVVEDFAIRFAQESTLLLLPVPDGHVVGEVRSDTPGSVRLTGTDGVFMCDFNTFDCVPE